MSLIIAARFARRELRGGLRGFRIFLACLALGVAAIAAVGTVRAGIQAGLDREGAALLGGDAEVELTYRFAREPELNYLNSIADTVSETVDFRSMAVTLNEDRALTQIRAVDDAYPLIGQVTLDPEMPLSDALADHGAVMEQVLVDRLGLAPGDTFRLGTQDFVLRAVLRKYPDNASAGFGLGPRTIVLTDALMESGLVAEGTLFSTQYRLDLPTGADLQTAEDQTKDALSDAGLRWRDSRRGAGGTDRFVAQIGSFLILMGLAGLAVGGVGVSAAVQSYLSGKTGIIATLKTLGATKRTIFLTYFLQIGALTILGVALGVIIGGALPVIFAPLIEARLPIPAEFTFDPRPLGEAAIYGLLAALIFTLWPLAKTEDVRAATLFRDAFGATRALPRLGYLIVTALLLITLVGLAIFFTGNAFLTLWTTGGILIALLFLVCAAILIRFIARRLRRPTRGRPALRLAVGAIGTKGGEATAVVLSLGLGLSVLASVGQIDANLRNSLANDLPKNAPSYFFVDIQPDQIGGFTDRLTTDPAVRNFEAAPMLRGIITTINGQDATTFANGHWVVRGDRGVTYADAMPDGTTITEGTWWPQGYSGPPLVSFADEEAREMGLSLGDELVINILGREITATIGSFREVSFEDAGMGFIVALNESALAGAPHSWISTVYAEENAEAQILRDLATAYPNITAIRIRDAIDQAITLISGISAATRYGALATLLTGFLVLIGAAAAGEKARTYEAAILKTLGASRGRILLSFALRAALLGFAAGSVALGAGILGGWAVATYIMETSYTVIWSNAFMIIGGGVFASLFAGLAFAIRPLSAKPAQVLRARE
jgi:putative ABC transport system permease protein